MCPKCGAKIKQTPKTSPAVWLFLGLIILGFWYSASTPSTTKAPDTRTPEQKALDEKDEKERAEVFKIVAHAQNRFKKTLKNPDSFKKIEYR